MFKMFELYDLKVLHMEQPVIDKNPYFSWKMQSSEKSILQIAYQIVVRNGSRILWDTGKVVSSKQSFIEYAGMPLESCREYIWSVRVWNNIGEEAMDKASFSTALLQITDWKAKWIECSFDRLPANEYKFGNAYPAIMFEKTVTVAKKINSAKVYASCHGVYQLSLNGNKADNRELAPEFTPYDRILYYQVYDIKDLLVVGNNLLQMFVGDGWYFSTQAGPVMKERHKEPSVIFQLEITYEDGSRDMVCSDGTEACHTDYIVYSDLYQGEKQDFTLEKGKNQPVIVKEYGYDMLKVQPMPEIAAIEVLSAKEIFTSPAGEMIVDFGQIVAGKAKIHMNIPRGKEVTLEYFEILNEDGNYINTMFAPQKDTYISDGKERIHEALFTFHGFRYIRVTGMEHASIEDFKAVLLSTRKENFGQFECSDERINRLYHNVRYSQYNNMMSVPSDCPTREKAGWTGDILIYAKTAMLNENMTPFLNSWLSSVRADQADDGVVMIVSPYMNLYDNLFKGVAKSFGDDKVTGVAGWSDAIVWVPYDMYQVTGNQLVLKENYDAMNLWAEYIIRTAKDKRGYNNIPEEYDQYLWNTGFHFGEWLIPSRKPLPGEGPYDAAKDSAYYVAPFFGYKTICKMSEIAAVLGDSKKNEYYTEYANKMKEAIQKGIFAGGIMPDKYMGAYILAFAFDLVPENLYAAYREKIVSLIHDNNDCLDTGFLATPFIMDVLNKIGERQLAYKLLWQNKMPSWLYEVDHGATCIWEAWDADEAKSTGRFVSFDHYAFGCIDDWMCRHIAGIDSDVPGFKHVIIHPDMEGSITSCKRSFISEAGEIYVEWTKEKLIVKIPCNASATVIWKGEESEIESGTYTF